MLFYNFIIFMIISLLWLVDAVLLMKGKRTINNKKTLSVLAQFFALAYSATGIVGDIWGEEYMPLLLVMFILLYFIMQYYFGTDYAVKVEKSQRLSEAVTKAIAEVECSKVEIKEENGHTTLTFPESKKTIEIKVRDSYVSSKEKVHTIYFKRWLSPQSKRDIMRSIEDYLYLHDDFKYKKLNVVSQFIGALIAIVISIFLISAALMEPQEIEVIAKDTIPSEIHELTSDNRYTNEGVIESLYQTLEYTGAYRWKNATLEDVEAVTELQINYGYPWRILYVGERSNMVLFINYSERAEQSEIHRLASKIFGIYNKQDGSYYRIYGGDGIYEILKQFQD